MRDRNEPDADGVEIDEEEADRLVREVGEALAAELQPSSIDRACDAFWLARTDALVAEMEEELSDVALVGVRGTVQARRLQFSLGSSVSVALTVDPIDRRVAGEVSPPATTARWLDRHGGSRAVALDERGRFDLVASRGPACLEVRLPDGRVVRTAWTLL
ncbi:MAG: hypothetical protein QOF97_134 [Acidimicrobiaceae bacterium]|jgi:hypothetical protein